jgi:hypothetical protein
VIRAGKRGGLLQLSAHAVRAERFGLGRIGTVVCGTSGSDRSRLNATVPLCSV